LTARKEKTSAPDQAPKSHHQPLMTRLQLAGFNLQNDQHSPDCISKATSQEENKREKEEHFNSSSETRKEVKEEHR
jgi:hypothetical protein